MGNKQLTRPLSFVSAIMRDNGHSPLPFSPGMSRHCQITNHELPRFQGPSRAERNIASQQKLAKNPSTDRFEPLPTVRRRRVTFRTVAWFGLRTSSFRSHVSMLTSKEPTRCFSFCVEEIIISAGIDVWRGVPSTIRFRDFRCLLSVFDISPFSMFLDRLVITMPVCLL